MTSVPSMSTPSKPPPPKWIVFWFHFSGRFTAKLMSCALGSTGWMVPRTRQ
jgi:hypothetical protein